MLILKRREMDGRMDLGKELERRWCAYLRFYPYWLDILREDDRERQRRQTAATRTLSLDQSVGRSRERGISGIELQKDYRNPHANLLEALIASSQGTLADWAAAYCTETQARHILRVAGGDTKTKIADDEAITQPAVSKSLKAALKRIREGLLRDGVLEG